MMLELYKSEFLRLRKGAMLGLLALFTLYFLLPRLGLWDILHRNMGFILTAGSIALSLAFGILHGILWRQKNFWMFLLHRPLAPHNIYLSLFAAGVTVIVATVFFSLMFTTLLYDGITDKVVDSRHYMFAIYITLVSIACYMIGTLTVLHRSKFVIIVFYTLGMVFFPEPRNLLAQYLPLVFMLVALFYLNLRCFKPDLNQPISSPLGTGLLAVGTSYGIVVAMLLATLVIYHLPLMIVGNHPDFDPKDGSMKMVFKDNFKHGIGYVLANSEHPQADHYSRQASLALRRNLPIQNWQPPRQNQFHRFDNSNALINPDTGAIWKFSHDEMLLLGVDKVTRQSIGAIGVRGRVDELANIQDQDRFSTVPHLSGGEFLSTENALYTLDFDTHTLILKHQTNAGEHYTSSLWAGDNFALISTNKHLLLFDINTLLDDFSELRVDHQIAYPDSVALAEYAYGMQVADGYLLIFLGENYFGFDRPGAEVFVTRLDGSFEQLGKREFTVHDHPSWIRHYNFMIAPFVFVSEELLMHSIDPYDTRFLSAQQLKAQQYPLLVYAVAICLQLMSILFLWLLVKGGAMQGRLRWTWMGLVAVLGLPALVSYLLLQPVRRN